MKINMKNSTLKSKASSLWKDNPYLQREWLRAVGIVRQTSRGYLLDKPVQRKENLK